MELEQIEQDVIMQISLNLTDSQDEVPVITGSTSVFNDISGFDSLRAIEVLVALETVYGRELPDEKVFAKTPANVTTVNDMAKAIKKIVEEA